jgi:hypothetical protein
MARPKAGSRRAKARNSAGSGRGMGASESGGQTPLARGGLQARTCVRARGAGTLSEYPAPWPCPRANAGVTPCANEVKPHDFAIVSLETSNTRGPSCRARNSATRNGGGRSHHPGKRLANALGSASPDARGVGPRCQRAARQPGSRETRQRTLLTCPSLFAELPAGADRPPGSSESSALAVAQGRRPALDESKARAGAAG